MYFWTTPTAVCLDAEVPGISRRPLVLKQLLPHLQKITFELPIYSIRDQITTQTPINKLTYDGTRSSTIELNQ